MNRNSERKGHLIGHIVTIAVAGIVGLAVILCIIAFVETRNAYQEMGEEELKVACLQLQHTIDGSYDGEWHIEDGQLWKGEYNMEGDNGEGLVEDLQKTMNDLKASTGLEYTIILDKTRALTTIDGMKGKDIGDAAYNSVKSGKPYADFKTKINEKNYYVYYSPETYNGKYVGCFFAGRLSEDVDGKINKALFTLILIAVLVTAAFVVVGLLLSNKYSKLMRTIAEDVDQLAGGELDMTVDPALIARRDELGIIAEGVKNLDDKLRDVISKTQEAAHELDTQSNDLADSAHQAS